MTDELNLCNDIQIREYYFEQTCLACLEQYDVYVGDLQIAYVKLRHGRLRVEHPYVGGKALYTAVLDDWEDQGRFADDEQRMLHLTKIADELDKLS